MDRQLLIYVYTALLTFVGLLCLFAAFRNMTVKEKMTKSLERPPIRNYGNPLVVWNSLHRIGNFIALQNNTIDRHKNAAPYIGLQQVGLKKEQ